MSKITVVIPTMWRGDKLENLLDRLNTIDRIDEILLIDNSPSEININLSQHTKINHIKMEENIYVNPAWNLGTKLAKNEIVSFMQDDTIFNPEFLETIQIEDDCLIGIDRKNFPPFSTDYNPVVIDCAVREWGYATILLFKKSSYINIPEDLKIWCGDDFLFHKFKFRKSILGLPLETKMSVTAMLPSFDDVRNQDEVNYQKYK